MDGDLQVQGGYVEVRTAVANSVEFFIAGIVQDAVEQVKSLKEGGFITKAGKVINPWPRHTLPDGRKRNNESVGFSRPLGVQELLEFFKDGGGADQLIDELGYKFTAKDIRKRLEI